MNEEEKKAIEILQGLCTDDCVNNDIVKTIVKLIKKQQDKIEDLKKKDTYNFKTIALKDIEELLGE